MPMPIEFEKDSLNWVRTYNAAQKTAHRYSAFSGNFCKMFLDKVDMLRKDYLTDCLKCVGCLRNF